VIAVGEGHCSGRSAEAMRSASISRTRQRALHTAPVEIPERVLVGRGRLPSARSTWVVNWESPSPHTIGRIYKGESGLTDMTFTTLSLSLPAHPAHLGMDGFILKRGDCPDFC
jgi:hypothetical protein